MSTTIITTVPNAGLQTFIGQVTPYLLQVVATSPTRSLVVEEDGFEEFLTNLYIKSGLEMWASRMSEGRFAKLEEDNKKVTDKMNDMEVKMDEMRAQFWRTFSDKDENHTKQMKEISDRFTTLEKLPKRFDRLEEGFGTKIDDLELAFRGVSV